MIQKCVVGIMRSEWGATTNLVSLGHLLLLELMPQV